MTTPTPAPLHCCAGVDPSKLHSEGDDMNTNDNYTIGRVFMMQPTEEDAVRPAPVRVRLAKELYVTFTFNDEGVNVSWDPECPSPLPRQLRRRYVAARDKAYRLLAAYLGRPVQVLGSGGYQLDPVASVIHPDGRVERVSLDGGLVH